ncbi:MAG: D-alanyl-D-alanine carboxypeptidase DacF precursor [bacterium ADurb.Bin400]|nr:MAG: D-alanyl-D-alanine carboxypeptidase DacF precursor [bacterium ADurb.Bin400]
MITKSLIIFSIILESLGITGIAKRFDEAVIRTEYNSAHAVVASNITTTLPDIIPRPKIKPGAETPQIFAKNYILVDNNTGKVLAKQAHKDRVPIASTTKMMTAIVALENYDLDEVATISPDAVKQIGATAHLRIGERITIHSLLKALLIKSGNDAAYALAEHMNQPGESGIEKFVNKMNEKARSLGLQDTNYRDPAGLDTAGYSTAYDLYVIASNGLRNQVFADIVSTGRDTVQNVDGTIFHDLKNSNRLVNEYAYPGAIGVKTGYMPEAGHILVSAAKRNDHTLIGVVINTYADTAPASADESRKLLDWGFSNIEW